MHHPVETYSNRLMQYDVKMMCFDDFHNFFFNVTGVEIQI